MLFAVISVVLDQVTSPCLSTNALISLNMTPVAPYTPPPNNTVCTGVFSTAQTCVNLTTLSNAVNIPKFSNLRNEYAGWRIARDIYLSSYNNITSFCTSNITTVNVNANRKVNGVSITNAMVNQCASFTSVASTVTSTANILASGNYSSCYDQVFGVTNGVFCILASNQATNYSTITGTTLNFVANTSVALNTVTKCGSLIFVSCLMNEMATFMDQFTSITTASGSLSTSCGPVANLVACVNTPSACPSLLAQSVFAQFFTPMRTRLTTALPRELNSTVATVRSYTVARLLQTLDSIITSTFIVNSTGYNVDTVQSDLVTETNAVFTFASADPDPTVMSSVGATLAFIIFVLAVAAV